MFSIFEEIKKKEVAHIQDVNNFIASVKTKFDHQFFVNNNINEEEFFIKLTELANKWLGGNASIGDCDGKRLVDNILYKQLNLTFVSMIIDDVNLFSQCDPSQPSPKYWMEIACIFGAPSIAFFILGKHGVDTINTPNVVPYAVSTGNEEFALKISKLFKDRKNKIPELLTIYSFGNRSLTNKVKNIFAEEPEKENVHMQLVNKS